MNFTLPEEDLEYIIKHTSQVWKELSNTSLFITGGTGFIGKWLLETFVKANQQFNANLTVFILVRDHKKLQMTFPYLLTNPDFNFISGDVRDFNFSDVKISHIIHAATTSCAKLDRENPDEMFATIVQGTQHTLDFCLHSRAKKFLLLSSGAIYGEQSPDHSHLKENDSHSIYDDKSLSAYARGKKTAEYLCYLKNKTSALDIKIARGFTFIGPYLPLNKHFAIGNFIYHLLQNEPITLTGNGNVYRSYLYAADLIIGLLNILCFGKTMQAYNVGSDQAVLLKDVAQLISTCITPNAKINILGKENAMKPPRYIPDTELLKHSFSLPSPISLTEAIKKTIHWHQSRKNYD